MWAVIAIPAAVTLLVVVIEAAHLWLAKLELQNALNAAALAGVKRWGDISEITSAPSPFHDTPGAFSITHAARVAAQAAAAANTVSGQSVSLDLNEADDGNNTTGYDNASCTGDILLGGFPTTGSMAFTTAASVGCGRTTTGGGATVVVPDEEFAVLTQKTMSVTPLTTQLFGVPLGTFSVYGRSMATGRCRGSSTTDPIVLNPQAVHFTSVSCSVP